MLLNAPRQIVYYTSARGEHTVRDEVGRLGKVDTAKVLRIIARLATYGESLGGDSVRHIRGKIWELRQDRYRVLYFAYMRNAFVLLRVFMKKTQKIPESEIRIAERRMSDYLARFPKDLPLR